MASVIFEGVIVALWLAVGKSVVNPVTKRVMPIIGDAVLVDPTVGTGAVKITPAHDPNDFECGQRHGLPQVCHSCYGLEPPYQFLPLPRFLVQINVLTDDGLLNAEGGPFAGQTRFEVKPVCHLSRCTLLTMMTLSEREHRPGRTFVNT